MEAEWCKQVEFYMSAEGIRRHATEFQEAIIHDGCLPLGTILMWPMMRKNGAWDAGEQAVAEALRRSPLLEVSARAPFTVGPATKTESRKDMEADWCKQVEFYMSAEGIRRHCKEFQEAIVRDGCLPLVTILTWPMMRKNGAFDAGEQAVAEALRRSPLLEVSVVAPFTVGPQTLTSALDGEGSADAGANLIPRGFQTCPNSSHAADAKCLVVMQFNVLADGLGQGQFKDRVPAEVLAFPSRFTFALCEVARVCPDILCMQETNHYHDFWERELTMLGFEGMFVPKYDPTYPSGHRKPPGYYQGKPSDGCSLFVKRDKLCLGRQATERFSRLTGNQSMTQVVIVAEVIDATTGKHLLTVSTSHLKAGGGHSDARMRQAQGKAWVQFLHDFGGSKPIVITGDMNEDARKASEGGVRSLCEGLDLSSAYALGFGNDPVYTAIDGAWRGCLDYILVSSGVEPLRLWTIPDDLPDGAIPSSHYPSDHLAIAAELQFP